MCLFICIFSHWGFIDATGVTENFGISLQTKSKYRFRVHLSQPPGLKTKAAIPQDKNPGKRAKTPRLQAVEELKSRMHLLWTVVYLSLCVQAGTEIAYGAPSAL